MPSMKWPYTIHSSEFSSEFSCASLLTCAAGSIVPQLACSRVLTAVQRSVNTAQPHLDTVGRCPFARIRTRHLVDIAQAR